MRMENYKKQEEQMLVIENNSVYEIDEECLKRRIVPPECDVYDKLVKIKHTSVEDKEKDFS